MKGRIIDLGSEYGIQIRLAIDQKPKNKKKIGNWPKPLIFNKITKKRGFSFWLSRPLPDNHCTKGERERGREGRERADGGRAGAEDYGSALVSQAPADPPAIAKREREVE